MGVLRTCLLFIVVLRMWNFQGWNFNPVSAYRASFSPGWKFRNVTSIFKGFVREPGLFQPGQPCWNSAGLKLSWGHRPLNKRFLWEIKFTWILTAFLNVIPIPERNSIKFEYCEYDVKSRKKAWTRVIFTSCFDGDVLFVLSHILRNKK